MTWFRMDGVPTFVTNESASSATNGFLGVGGIGEGLLGKFRRMGECQKFRVGAFLLQNLFRHGWKAARLNASM